MRVMVASIALGLAACAFDPGGLRGGDGDGGDDDDAAELDAAGPAVDAPLIDAPLIDARVIDGSPIDAPPPCPTGYLNTYRYIGAPTTWLAAEQDCENDQPGRTHLAVINGFGEAVNVIANLSAIGAGDEVWIGVVRDPGSPTWRWVTGGTATYLPWAQGQPDRGDQYVVRVEKFDGGFYDRTTTDPLPALCECDGLPPVNADYDPGTP